MIDPNKLTQEDIGRWVIYNNGFDPPTEGKLKSWNKKYIFVVFKCNNDWSNYQNYTGESCSPEDLFFKEDFNEMRRHS